MSDGKVTIDTELDFKGAENGLRGLSNTLGKFGKVGATALKGTAVAVGATTTAITGLVTASTNAYASYEQLVGGVDTLFKESSKKVQAYADEAYKTAGLSANDYMETVTSFSASLLQGLGGDTEKAADVANKAVTDMSDNANKMGTDMSMIQNAYQGFAKQNYTMLDNLKLGYGGTQAEMARLINDSGVLGDSMKVTAKTVNDVSFDKQIEAIHVIQTQLGITGTTAKEAATTIEGSANAMKSAWTNLVSGMAQDGADLDGLIDTFVDSTMTFTDNLMPVVEQSLGGVSSLIEQLLPRIASLLPGLLDEIVPGLLSAGSNIVVTLIQGILNNLPKITPVAMNILLQLSNSMWEMSPKIIESGLQIIYQLAIGITEALPTLIPTIVDVMLQIVDILLDNIDLLIDAATELIIALSNGLIDALPILIDKAPTIVEKLLSAIIKASGKLVLASRKIIIELGAGLISNIPKLLSKVPAIILALVNGIKSGAKSLNSAGKNIIDGIWQGISANLNSLKSKVKSVGTSILNSFKNALGIHSPSKVMKDQVGKNIDLGIAEGIEKNEKRVKNSIVKFSKNVLSAFKSSLSEDKFKKDGQNLVDKLTEGVNSKLDYFKKSVKNIEDSIQKSIDDVKSKQEDLANTLKDTGGDLYTKDEKGNIILSDIKKQTAQVSKLGKNLNSLKGKLSKDLMNEILSMSGDDALQFTNELLKLSSKELNAYNDAYVKKMKKSNKIAKSWYADDIKELETTYSKKVTKQFNKLKNRISKLGNNALNGFLKPFKNDKKVTSAIGSFCDDVIKKVKKKFDIHSPSKVFENIGEMNALGLVDGFTNIDPMKQINSSIDNGLRGLDSKLNNELVVNSTIDYDKMAKANAEALQKSGLSVNVDGRILGRVVRKNI